MPRSYGTHDDEPTRDKPRMPADAAPAPEPAPEPAPAPDPPEVVQLQAYRDKVLTDLDQKKAALDAEIHECERQKGEIEKRKAQTLADYETSLADLKQKPS